MSRELRTWYGQWERIGEPFVKGRGVKHVLARCSCGVEKSKRLTDLENGASQKCAACSREASRFNGLSVRTREARHMTEYWIVKLKAGPPRWINDRSQWHPNRACAQKFSRSGAYLVAADVMRRCDGVSVVHVTRKKKQTIPMPTIEVFERYDGYYVSVNGIDIGGEYAQLHANDCASDLRRALGMPEEQT